MNKVNPTQAIRAIKSELGKRLVILTHHYQRREIVAIGDFCGDSFMLSKKAAEDESAEFIVFCGVHFMAESAAILARDHQVVQIPDMEAGCWMADMVDCVMVEKAWREITAAIGADKIIPVVYVNSDADIKAFCGRLGGMTCTSANAHKAFQWVLEQGKKVFFLPDRYLGANAGRRLGIKPDAMSLWDPEQALGGNPRRALEQASLVLWEGHCLVHTRFEAGHIKEARRCYPHGKIVVHPECRENIVQSADAVGSTSFIVKYVEDAPAGATILIGTETNLVQRLAATHPDKQVLPLSISLCPNMMKITLEKLLLTLENPGKWNVVTVPDDIKKDARKALERMLRI